MPNSTQTQSKKWNFVEENGDFGIFFVVLTASNLKVCAVKGEEAGHVTMLCPSTTDQRKIKVSEPFIYLNELKWSRFLN
jgi:hypothetical protein